MSVLFRPRLAFWLAAAVVLVLSFAGSPRHANAEIHQITTGELNWGLKESWRNYTGGAAVSEGATLNPDGTTKYPLLSGTFDDETNTTVLEFGGSSWYRSWWEFISPGKWALDTTVKDLRIVISPTEQVLRGTVIGYSQDDPGGELHTDIDVVLAQILLDDNQGITFDAGVSKYDGLATLASNSLGLYTPGTPLDRLWFNYQGQGGLPDTGEKLGKPGELSLEEGTQRHLSDWNRETHTQSNRALYMSPDGSALDFVELKSSTTANAAFRFTRIDAETLEQVGEAHTITGFPVFNGNRFHGRHFKMDQNPETGEIFFARGGMGDDQLEVWLMRALWDAEEGEYVVDKVGEVGESTINGSNLNELSVGPVIWNEVLEEIQVIIPNTATTDIYDRDSILRFKQVDGAWQREIDPIRAPDTGEYAGAVALSTPWSLQTSILTQSVAVARDGSLVFPSKTASFRYPNPQGGSNLVAHLPGAQLKFEGTGVSARYIPGTMLGDHPAFGTYYGWTSASNSYDGSVLIHNSQWGMASFLRVDLDQNGDAKVVGPTYMAEDSMPPYQAATLGRIVSPDPVRGWDWVIDITDAAGRVLNAFQQVDGEDVMFSRHGQSEYTEAAVFGDPPVVHPDGHVYLTVRDQDTQRAAIVRMEFKGRFAEIDEVPADQSISLDTGEESEAVSFTSTVEGGDPAPERQWQVKRAGESAFTDIEGETGENLEVVAKREDNGNQYRALYTSDAGRIATEPASLEVRFAPFVINEPVDANVPAGSPATFVAMPGGNPQPDVTWQIRLGGVWQNVDLDTGQFEVSGEHGGFLAVKDTNADMDGLKFRARLRNRITLGSTAWNTTFSREVTLRVSAVETQRIYFDAKGSKAEWGVSNRYRCYVTGNIGRGWIEVEGGAEQIPGTTPTGGLCAGTNSATGKPWGTGGESLSFGIGSAVFPEVGDEPLSPIYDPDNNRLRVDLAGTVRFLGHTYHNPGNTTPLLKTELSNFRVEADFDSGQGFIYVDAVGTNMDSDVPLNVTGVKIAEFDAAAITVNPVDGRVTVSDVPTFLHQEGVQIFGNYPVGEPMDSLNLDLAVGEKPERPDQPEPPIGKVRAPAVKKLGVSALKGNTAVVRVVCPAAARSGCRITVPKKATLASAGKTAKQAKAQLKRGAAVAAPKKLASGKAATVRLKLTVKQRRALRNRMVTARFRLVSASVGGKVDRRNVTVRSRVR